MLTLLLASCAYINLKYYLTWQKFLFLPYKVIFVFVQVYDFLTMVVILILMKIQIGL